MTKTITQSDYTSALVRKRNDLADNIEVKGVEASQEEKLNTLVPKVLEISTGGRGGAPLISDVKFVVPLADIQSAEQYIMSRDVKFAASDCIDFEFEEETA